MTDFIIKLLALIGFLVVLAALFGALGMAEFHVYFGRDATKWHTKLANERGEQE